MSQQSSICFKNKSKLSCHDPLALLKCNTSPQKCPWPLTLLSSSSSFFSRRCSTCNFCSPRITCTVSCLTTSCSFFNLESNNKKPSLIIQGHIEFLDFFIQLHFWSNDGKVNQSIYTASRYLNCYKHTCIMHYDK